MASVRVEDDAFSDTRYEVLAKACLLADADHARGKMLRIWRQCTAEGRYVLSADDVEVVLGENGITGLERARLGVRVDGGIRIKGTEGRIEWLAKLKENAKKGGEAKAAKRQADESAKRHTDESAKRQPIGSQNSCPLTLTLTPTPESSIPVNRPSKSASGKTASRESKSVKSLLPESWTPPPELELTAQRQGINLAAEVSKLRDWAKANAVRKADWDAVARNWIRKAVEDLERVRGQARPAQLHASEPRRIQTLG